MSIGIKQVIPDISVIIVTYNSEKYIKNCIDSILRHWPKEYSREIIILDNQSNDKTIQIVQRYSQNIINLVENRMNTGFAKAVNLGIRKSSGRKLLLLNPDTRILTKQSIKLLMDYQIENGASICGGTMQNSRGEHKTHVRLPNIAIGLFDFTNLAKIFPDNYWHRYFYYLNEKKTKTNIDVGAVSGGYMMIDKNLDKRIGGFNEKYFMYLEDIEYCKKAHDHNIRVVYIPNSKIWHEGGGSSNTKDRINFDAWIKSRRLYFWNNLKIFDNLVIQPAFLVDEIIMRVWRKIK